MRHSPVLRRIILEVTNHCNLDCSMCLRRSWREVPGTMSNEVFTKLISDLRDYPSPPDVFFGGYGEPLSHPDILAMVSRVAATGSKTSLITNGILLSRDLVNSLVEAGLKKLWISADSFHQNAHIQSLSEENYQSILGYLADLLRSRNGNLEKLEPGLALVLTRNNQSELLDQLNQGLKLGLRSVFITCLEKYSASQAEEPPYSLQNLRQPGSWRSVYADFIGRLEELSAKKPGVSIEGPLTDPGSKCPFAEKGDLVLRWDGEISPCLPLLYDRTTHIGSWEHKQYSHSLGNIRNRSLIGAWTDSENILLRQRLLNKEFSPCLDCRDCWLSEDNRLDCMGFEHPVCGGCLWAVGLISCP